ncbi:MAG: immunoglobulin-like domain-containing protein [Lachnospiraceae bacterium]|jgi:peptidoglycan/xylan/chitin deacetylase (PgdA/CDA1 family)
MKKKVLIICAIIAAAVITIAAAFLLFIFFTKEVFVTLHGDSAVEVAYGDDYEEPGAEAFWMSPYFDLLKWKLPVTVSGEVDNRTLGTYTLAYTAEYMSLRAEATRSVTVADNKPPVIMLDTIHDYYTHPGQPYVEEGFQAIDNHDGDLTAFVTRKEKDGIVYYSVSDSSGNKTTVERTIFYDDRESPVIVFEGSDSVIEGRQWKGTFWAWDNVEGDVTGKVHVEGAVDTSTPGEYTLNYSVTDNYGNIAKASRVVTVTTRPRQSYGTTTTVGGDNKIVFLTFDDGPGPHTARLLDILASYNVPATFFVCNNGGYNSLIGRAYNEGHAVGVHCNSHWYGEIYVSTDAYWTDFNIMNDIIEQQTGSRADFFRFPGGSSNTVSRTYKKGIMSELAAQADERGLDYIDWNVSSGDAGGATTTAQVVQNVINGMNNNRVSVVLIHDSKGYSVDAVSEIIEYGLTNGFTFMKLANGTVTCRHGISN